MSSQSSPFLLVDCVGITYQADSQPVKAVQSASLAVQQGEFIAIVGPSGCGKSTLMRSIAGLRPVSEGQIVLDGRKVDGPVLGVGMVFQAPVLLKWRNVIDNVLLPAELAGLDRTKFKPRAEELLKLTGLEDFRTKFPNELSGGMQQRVSLCRALLLDPPLLLMDEPFGALDAMTRDEMNFELLRIWSADRSSTASKTKTVLFVTHSIPEAVLLADRVVVMTPRPGRISSIIDVPLPRPRDMTTRAKSAFGELSLRVYEALSGRAPPSAVRDEGQRRAALHS